LLLLLQWVWKMVARSSLFSSISAFAFALALSGCGASYNETEIKDFRLAVLSSDAAIQDAFRSLVATFNQSAGVQALRFEADAKNANSAIILTPGLTARDGKVGWGQWLTETEEEPAYQGVTGRKLDREITYTMRLELDSEYVGERVANPTKDKQYDLLKLFCHEVGHGLLMGHHTNPKDVMYYDISGQKDFDAFWPRVKEFFAR
jgi:hypothetical protein